MLEATFVLAQLGVILAFGVFVTYSKHLHIALAPLNVLFSRRPNALARRRRGRLGRAARHGRHAPDGIGCRGDRGARAPSHHRAVRDGRRRPGRPRSRCGRQLRRLDVGQRNLVADLGGRPGRNPSGAYPPAVEEARTRILYAARAGRVMPIDTVLVDIADLDLLRRDSVAAASSGFAAKACIHPSQVAVVREGFRPTLEQIGGRGK